MSGVYGNNLASDLTPVSGGSASAAESQTSEKAAESCSPADSRLARDSATGNATPAPRPEALPGGRAPIAIPRGEWKWYGHAAHLIVGQSCRFHLATEIGEYLVSTVGEYWPERAVREIHAQVHDPSWLAGNRHRRGDDFDMAYMTRFGFEEIGCDRKYETMVFRLSGERCTRPDCGCGLPAPTSWGELDSDGYNDAGAATAGHLALCEKFAALAAVERAS